MNKFSFSLLVLLTAFLAGHAVEPSGTLPVLVIETKNSQPIESKSTYVKGTYYLDPRGAEGIEAIGTAENPLPLQIKGRGNFTWYSFSKKPYRLKLDKKAALLGMNSSKHYALLAHADDNRAFMRNLSGFEVSRMAGLSWTPADQPCEVMLNGDYIGLYSLTGPRNASISPIPTTPSKIGSKPIPARLPQTTRSPRRTIPARGLWNLTTTPTSFR